MRKNKTLGLYSAGTGTTIAEVANAVPDASQFQKIRIQMTGGRIQVWINQNVSSTIDYTDPNPVYTSGYTFLCLTKTDCSFDDVHISKPPNTPVVTDDGAYQTSLNTLHATCTIPPWGAIDYQYAIGTTSGGITIRGWTPCSGPEITATGLTLANNTTYYISMKYTDSEGPASNIGTSNGITVVQTFGSPGEVKNCANNTVIGTTGVVTANSDSWTRTLYVESLDRSSAIKVKTPSASPPNPAIGSIVSVVGTLLVAQNEQYINVLSAAKIAVTGTTTPLKPVGMQNKAIAGDAFGSYTSGVLNGIGLNNVGLLVTAFGRVKRVDTVGKLFYIEDGCMMPNETDTGVSVSYGTLPGDITAPGVGSFVKVTGISGIRLSGTGDKYPIIKLRGPSDLVIY
jgi:hypothetical protein